MSTFLHQIFYANNKFGSDVPIEVYKELSKWAVPRPIYISQNVLPINQLPHIMSDVHIQVNDSRTNTLSCKADPNIDIQSPPYTDKPTNRQSPSRPVLRTELFKNLSIFQSIFLLEYGYAEYMMSKNRILNRELEEKQKIMETLSKTPKKLKDGNHKLTNDNIQEILSGLLVATKEEIMHLVAYAFYYNRIIYLVFTHSYLVISPTKNTLVDETNIDSVFILNQTRKHPKYGGSYFPDLEPTLEKLGNIHNTKINLEHYAKPFKGVSAYKLPELEEMANKIGIFEKDCVVKYKKKELYEKIVEICCAGICA